MIKVKSICCFVVLAFAVFFISGCATTQTPVVKKPKAEYQKDVAKIYEQIKEGDYAKVIPYTLRDYVIKGVIFVESKVTIDVNGERTGSEITNYMLMKEAQKLGANDIINVRIDEREESKVVDNYDKNAKFIDREYKKRSYVYQATALAIKYTNAIYGDKATLESKNSITINPAKIENEESSIKQGKNIKQQSKLKK
ncbi:MAG: hypothetical protein IKN42_04010 [Elusimicrobia bacterium]|nr:hypothetical protein [Elusimicrobiota bacterium]